jgi:hypothetical protein
LSEPDWVQALQGGTRFNHESFAAALIFKTLNGWVFAHTKLNFVHIEQVATASGLAGSSGVVSDEVVSDDFNHTKVMLMLTLLASPAKSKFREE